MSRELVILTHQYPHAGGDTSFVESEISSLASRFDRIYIWTLSPSNLPLVEMPENVEVAGSLLTGTHASKWVIARAAIRHLPAVLRLSIEELNNRGRAVKPGRLVRSAVITAIGGRRLGTWLRDRIATGTSPVIYSFWGTDCALALLSSHMPESKSVVRMHRYDMYEDYVGYLPFRRQLFERAETLLTVSQHGAEYLERTYGARFALPPVVVSRLGTPDRGKGPTAPSDIVRIVSCSTLTPVKRVHAIFEVVNALAEERPVHWVHFGDGASRDDLEARLEGRSEHLSVELRGAVGRSEILEYYATTPISAFMNLSISEGLPVSIMEAMSFGIPVVATDVGGSGEIVGRQWRSGVLVGSDAVLSESLNAVRAVIDSPAAWDPRRVWDDMCNATRNGDAVADLLRDGVPSTG